MPKMDELYDAPEMRQDAPGGGLLASPYADAAKPKTMDEVYGESKPGINREMHQTVAQETSPEQEALVERIHASTSMPKEVIRSDPRTAEAYQQFHDIQKATASAPATARFLAMSENMALARDKAAELAKAETNLLGYFWQNFKATPSQIASGNVASSYAFDLDTKDGLNDYLTSLTGMEKAEVYKIRAELMSNGGLSMEDALREAAKQRQAYHKEYWAGVRDNPTYQIPDEYKYPKTFWEKVAAGAGGSTPGMLMTAINPLVGTAFFTQQIYGSEYENYVSQGVAPERARDAAMASALMQMPLEYAGNMVQLGRLAQMFKGGTLKTFLTGLVEGSLSEGLEEYLQSYPQYFAEIYAKNPGMTAGEALAAFIPKIASKEFQADAIEQGLIGGTIGGIMQVPGAIRIKRQGKIVQNILDEQGRSDISQREHAAMMALRQDFLESGLSYRSQRAAEAFMRGILETHEGLPQDVYIPGPAMLQALEANPEEAGTLAEALGISQDEVAQAAATDTDIVVPMVKYAANAFGTQTDAALMNDLRLSPNTYTANQMLTVQQEFNDELKAQITALRSQEAAETVFDQEREQVFKDVLAKREASGMATNAAQADAVVFAASMAAMSKRYADGSPMKLYKAIGLQVEGEGRIIDEPEYSDADGVTYNQNTGRANIDTPEFKTWFGESKVVDADGKPLVVYHGTNKDFEAFESRPALRGGFFGHNYEVTPGAFFFTPDKALARQFMENRSGEKLYGDSPRVMELYISLRNPLDLTKKTSKAVKILEKAGLDFKTVFGLKETPIEFSYLERDRGRLKEAERYLSDHPGDEYYENLVKEMETLVAEHETYVKPYLRVGNYDFDAGDLWQIADHPEVIEGLKKAGYDGLIVNERDAAKQNDAISYAVFDPTQIKSVYNRGTFDPNDPRTMYQSLSSRVPWAKGHENDALAEVLTLDFDVTLGDTKTLTKNMANIMSYPNMRKLKGKGSKTPAVQAEAFVEHAKANLLALFDAVPPEIRDRAKLWYDGGKKVIRTWSGRYGVSEMQGAAVIAVLSPQKDWYQNLTQAERILDIVHGQQSFEWTPQMEEKSKAIEGTQQDAMSRARGKTLAEIMDDKLAAACWIRVFDETYNDRGYRVVAPEGGALQNAKTAKGAYSTSAWGSYNEIAKAVSVLTDGSAANVHYQIGTNHKVRNFYNNLFDPSAGDYVTIDTHAVAAALMRPLAQSDIEVMQNFGSGGSASSSLIGQRGTYSLYAEAYRRAAEERGVLPREMQSITWEAVRGMFEGKKSPAWKKRVDSIWERYKAGEIEQDEAQRLILEMAGGVPAPAWASRPYNDKISRTYDRKAGVGFEVAPSPANKDLADRWRSLPLAEQQGLTKEVAAAIVPRVLEELGLSGIMADTIGGYMGDTSASLSISLPDDSRLLEVGKALGYVLSQESVVVAGPKPFEGGKKMGAVTIQLPEGYTATEIKALYDSLWQLTGSNGQRLIGGHTTVNGQMVIINFTDLTADELGAIIDSHLEKRFTVYVDPVYATFVGEQEYGYDLDNQERDPSGSSLGGRLDSLRAEASGILQESLRQRGRAELYQRGAAGRSLSTGRLEVETRYGERRDGSDSVLGIHYSGQPRVKLSGRFYGTGLKGAEARRVAASGDPDLAHRIHFYVDTGDGIVPEMGVGSFPHAVHLDNLYNEALDPLGLKPQISHIVDNDEWMNTLEQLIIANGYDGIFAPKAQGNQGVAVLIGKRHSDVPVDGVQGLQRLTAQEVAELEVVPPGTIHPNKLNWAIPALIEKMVLEDGLALPGGLKLDDVLAMPRPRADALKAAGVDPAKYASSQAKATSMLYQRNDPVPAFYSRLTSIMDQKLPGKGPAHVFLQAIESWKKKGLSGFGSEKTVVRGHEVTIPGPLAEELHWSGLEEWLKEQGKSKITKSQVLAYLQENQLEITEHHKADIGMDPIEMENIEWEFMYRDDDVGGRYDDEEVRSYDLDNGDKVSILKIQTRRGTKYESFINGKLLSYDDDSFDAAMQSAASYYERDQHRAIYGPSYTGGEALYTFGGENYREIVFTAPGRKEPFKMVLPENHSVRLIGDEYAVFDDGGEQVSYTFPTESEALNDFFESIPDDPISTGHYKSSHWSENNPIAHVRFQEFRDADGMKVLLLDEIQSDAEESYKRTGSPALPMATSSRWMKLVMRRMIRYAAENGYRRVAWTTGEMQNQRYKESLVRAVSRVDVGGRIHAVTGERTKSLDLHTNKGVMALGVGSDGVIDNVRNGLTGLKGKHISEVLGKELSETVMAAEDGTSIKTKDLEVKGEGKKNLYDKQMPTMFGQLIKPWGGKVGTTTIHVPGTDALGAVSGNDVMEKMGIPEKERSAYWRNLGQEERDRLMEEYRAGGPQEVHSFDVTLDMVKDVLYVGQPLFQNRPPQGSTSNASVRLAIGERSDTLVRLFNSANESSFLHEGGHIFFELLGHLAQQPGATEAAKADWKLVLDAVPEDLNGDSSGSAVGLTNKQHEWLARTVEAYFMEGKAPSLGLRKVFQKFSDWLKSIYTDLRGLSGSAKQQINPTKEITALLDRMFATDEEIKQAQDYYGQRDAYHEEASSISDEEHQMYLEALQEAEDVARDNRLRRYTRAWAKVAGDRRAREARIRAEVEKEPVYSAMDTIRNEDNGRMDIDALDALVGEETRKKLGKKGLTKTEGSDPEIMAARHGFNSVDEMVGAMLEAENKTARVKRLTDEEETRKTQELAKMVEDKGQPQAVPDVHNDVALAALFMELGMLRKKLGKAESADTALKSITATAKRNAVRDSARRQLEAMPVSKARRYDTFSRAEQKAAREALAATKKGDYATAEQAKLRQIINHALVLEAVKVREEVAKSESMVKKVKKQKSLLIESRGIIDNIAARYGFNDVPRSKVSQAYAQYIAELEAAGQKIETLASWSERMEAEGLTVFAPEWIDSAPSRPHQELTLSQWRDVTDAIRSIQIADRMQRIVISDEKRRSREQLLADLTAWAETHSKVKQAPTRHVGKARELVSATHAWHMKMEMALIAMDGGSPGLFWETFYLPFEKAANEEFSRLREANAKINDLFGVFTLKDRVRMSTKQEFIPEIKSSLTRWEIIMAALNSGNEGNLDRLKRGERWNDAQHAAVIDRLEKGEMDFVQGVWDYIDSFREESFALERELTGRTPQRVEPRPLQTRHGVYRGGYFPVVTDPKLGYRAAIQQSLDSLTKGGSLKGTHHASAVTRRGHLKERNKGTGEPLKLEPEVITNHIFQVIHDLTHRKAVQGVAQLANDPGVMGLFQTYAGLDMAKQLMPWVQDIASEQNGPQSPLHKAARWARTGTTLMSMGFKATTGVTQFVGYTSTIDQLKGWDKKWAAAGLATVYRNPANLPALLRETFDKSKFMEGRIKSFDRDIADSARRLSGKDAVRRKINEVAFLHIGVAQMGVDLPTWWAMYAKTMAETGDETKAVRAADSFVRQTQGSGATKDLARIQRGDDLTRAFTMFYSFFNTLYNMAYLSGKYIEKQGMSAGGVAAAAGSVMWLWVLPALLSEYVAGRGPDDDEDVVDWAMPILGLYPTQAVVGLRDAANAIGTSFDYALSPAQAPVESVDRWVKSIKKAWEEEDITLAIEPTIQAAGYLMHLPLGQPLITGGNIIDYATGRDPEFYLRDLFFRKPKDRR